MVADIIRFLLFWETTKKPIPRAKIVEHASLPPHVKGSAFDYLMFRARQQIRDIFGLDLIELEGFPLSFFLSFIHRLSLCLEEFRSGSED